MGTLTCRIELNKANGTGVVITVEDEAAGTSQRFQLDGTTITTEVRGGGDTSTIVQEADRVAIRCKRFTLEADTIRCRSREQTAFVADGPFSVKSGEDLELASDRGLKAKAAGNAAIDGKDVAISAKAKAKLAATELELSAKAKAARTGGIELRRRIGRSVHSGDGR